MANPSQKNLKWIMRAGYGARGVIYLLVGGLALLAAFKSTSASGTKGALATLRDWPFGPLMLWMIAAGLGAYMVWRIVAGIADVDDHGTDTKGALARASQVATGLLHGAIGLSVAGLAMGGGSGGDSAQDWTQKLMAMPYGRYLVAVAAVILLGAGIYYAHKGWKGSYKEHLAASSFTRSVDPMLTFGLVVYGAMLALVAASLGIAALNSDPSQAGGLGQALTDLRSATFGRILLGGAGVGLVAFALYNFVEAKFRIVPKVTGADMTSLSS